MGMARRSIVVDTAIEPLEIGAEVELGKPKRLTHMTITAFARKYSLVLPPKELPSHGRALVKLSRQHNAEIQKIEDARWGYVNAYDVDLMHQYFGGEKE